MKTHLRQRRRCVPNASTQYPHYSPSLFFLSVRKIIEAKGGGTKTASSASAVSINGSWLVVRPEERGRGATSRKIGIGEGAVREAAEEAKDELAGEDVGYEGLALRWVVVVLAQWFESLVFRRRHGAFAGLYDSGRTSTLDLVLDLWFPPFEARKAWLAQANHIFTELQELEHVKDYVCVYQVQFILRIPYKHDIPEGYLFVCPLRDFHTNTKPHANLYQWPACPAYWSFDPSGADHLSTEDARNLGFPAIHIKTIIVGLSWDRSVYRGLRQFHEGKGFDPDSREVARRLGYPLYEVLHDRVPFLARDG
ncbi:hypothetical protein MSAN_02445500 [Mycena sanguinolenta]|uniref:Uncharacterized protein n=1 Tax=Mycena sanguinolenta TaxID=230812 RepID=A0A8H7CAP2_9AGAR|nr:hypothetical protein MSAN_02445500 [Mycena sanguinolenta]